MGSNIGVTLVLAKQSSLFNETRSPRVYAMPPGCDFASYLVSGIVERHGDQDPVDLARIEIFANTRSLQTQIKNAFVRTGDTFIPKIRLITDLANHPGFLDIPKPESSLRRRLELTQAVAVLLEGDERFGPHSSKFALATSLEELFNEMWGEGVKPGAIRSLDLSDQSTHWQQSLKFLNIIEEHWANDSLGTEARMRLVIERLAEQWSEQPPYHPIIVAGSTGSQGATQLFMRSVANLPQGALILPCFDFELPNATWEDLSDPMLSEDHPQYRYRTLMKELDIGLGNIVPWAVDFKVNAHRNKFLSLMLRPAPVTDQWMVEGPQLKGLEDATKSIELIEAPSRRIEATAIALRLRRAVARDEVAALVTPDRGLVRLVKTALKRWNLIPVDSMGESFHQTVQGRFLIQVARLMGREADAEAIIALLEHPLTNTGEGRPQHRILAAELNLYIRTRGPEYDPTKQMSDWASKHRQPEHANAWLNWHLNILDELARIEDATLSELVKLHLEFAERIAAGTSGQKSADLFRRNVAAGLEADRLMKNLMSESEGMGIFNPEEYSGLFFGVASQHKVLQAYTAHPNIHIWNTEDARMEKPDVIIAGGLNNGTWPIIPTPDPWLNRDMRRQAGLLLPERRIGLSAHDFQQVMSVPKVVLTRSIRDAEAPTVPSRWLSRLTSLLEGLGEEGKLILDRMRTAGDSWVELAIALDKPDQQVPPAPRPAPCPPVDARPRALSVTQVSTLITDPYAIYARVILGLRPVHGLRVVPSPMVRGIMLHDILNEYVENYQSGSLEDEVRDLNRIARRKLTDTGAPPFAERVWLARFLELSQAIVEFESRIRIDSEPIVLEERGEFYIDDIDFTLKAKADRVDVERNAKDEWRLYDYKSGAMPSKKSIRTHDKQMPLQAILLEKGAFTGGMTGNVQDASYIGIGGKFACQAVDRLDNQGDLFARTWDEFVELIRIYNDPAQGYVARGNLATDRYGREYDHLARYGEWDDTNSPDEAPTS